MPAYRLASPLELWADTPHPIVVLAKYSSATHGIEKCDEALPGGDEATGCRMGSELKLGAKVGGNRNTLDAAKNKRSRARSLAAVTSDAMNALRRAGQLLRNANCTIGPQFTARLT